jgi:uncharacterized protein
MSAPASATESDPVFAVGERLIRAIEAKDADGVAQVYAADAIIWHNYDQIEQSAAENVELLRWAVQLIADMRYEQVRRYRTTDGFVQQHILRGRAPDGTPLEIPACLVCTVRDGRITRLDEYLDTAQLAALQRAAAGTAPA